MSNIKQNNNPSKEKIERLIQLLNSGQNLKVEKDSKRLLTKYKKSITVLSIIAAAQVAQDKLKNALHSYKKITAINSKHLETYLNIAIINEKLGHIQESINNYNYVIELQPDNIKAYFNKGILLQASQQYNDAINSYKQVIKLQPSNYEAFNNIGQAFHKIGDLKKALKSYLSAIKLNPVFYEAYYNQALALEDSGKIYEAIQSYQNALDINNSDPQIHWNLSLLQIMTGNLKDGWQNYKYGKFTKEKDRRFVQTPYVNWNGEKLTNKRILITAEQGIGDEIMFCSCIPDLIKHGPSQIIIECDQRISKILTNSFEHIATISRNNRSDDQWKKELGEVDYHIQAGDLPSFFRSNNKDSPQTVSYLIPDTQLIKKWKKRYDKLEHAFNIGISWKGGINDQNRSFDLSKFVNIFSLNANFINLQYGDYSHEITLCQEQYNITINDWDDADSLLDLDNFSAQLAALDLVISVDNSTLHFAGAIGVKTYALLPYMSNYRWMINTNRSLWYPSVTLFRQKKSSNWDNVLNEIHSELNTILA